MKNPLYAVLALAASWLMAAQAQAAQPVDWQIGFQPAATDIMREITWFNNYTLWFITPITILVLVLLVIVIVRFHRKTNPNPSRTSHNTTIELLWTVGPIIILLALAIPSFQLLNAQFDPPDEPQITIKATGWQWYWNYEYQVEEGIAFDSYMLANDQRAELGKEDRGEYPRLLAVDSELVVPVDTTVRLLVTAADVIHAFAMPAFGVKMDAVPGRLNETWFKADAEGLYYGQCSELCGKDHAYMPIGIRVVSAEQYGAWLAAAGESLEKANAQLMTSIEADKKSVELAANADKKTEE